MSFTVRFVGPKGRQVGRREQAVSGGKIKVPAKAKLLIVDDATGKPVKPVAARADNGDLVLDLGNGFVLVLEGGMVAASGADAQAAAAALVSADASVAGVGQVADSAPVASQGGGVSPLVAVGLGLGALGGAGLALAGGGKKDRTPPAAPTGLDLAAADDTGASDSDNLTRTASGLTVRGKAEPGSQVTLFSGAAALGTATADAAGDFTVDITLPAGANSVTAKATDAAGNVGAESQALTITVDATAPAAPTGLDLAAADDTGASDSDNSTRTASGLTITGKAEPGLQVTLFNGAASLGTATANAAGDFTLDVTLPAGANSVTAKATDAAGNVSAASQALTVTVDVAAPAAPTGLDLAAADDTGSADGDNLTSNASALTISGQAEANATVALFDGAVRVGTATANAVGVFSLDVSLDAGVHSLTAKATDAAGNESVASAALAVTVDATAPSATLLDVNRASKTVTLTFDSSVDVAALPLASAFAVTTGASEANAVTAVAASGSTVTLTLANDIGPGTITVIYTDPTAGNDAAAVQDAAGNDAASFELITGVVADGYVRGARLFAETSSGGVVTRVDTGLVTDANGNFYIPARFKNSTLVAVGGVNVDTGVPNTVEFRAAAGSTVINPLTTLVQAVLASSAAGTSVAQAEQQVSAALGITLPTGARLSRFDPISQGNVAIQRAAATVASVVMLADAAASADEGRVISNFAAQIQAAAASNTALNLSSATFVTGVLAGTTSATNASVASDIAGAISTIAAAQTFAAVTAAQSAALDEIAPATPGAPDLAASGDTGVSSADNITSNTSLTLRASFEARAVDGTAVVAGDRAVLELNGNSVTTKVITNADIAAGFVDVVVNGVAEGTYSGRIKMVDQAGNASSLSSPLVITVDATAPAGATLAFANLVNTGGNANQIVTSDNSFTLNLAGAEQGAALAYEISTDGGRTWAATTVAQTSIADGNYSYRVRLTDAAGNVGVTPVIGLAVDTIAPTTPTVTALTTSNTAPVIAGTATLATGETLNVTVNGAVYENVAVTNGAWSVNTATATPRAGTTFGQFGNGSFSVTAVVTDRAGNFTADATANEITVRPTFVVTEVNGVVAFSGSATGAISVSFANGQATFVRSGVAATTTVSGLFDKTIAGTVDLVVDVTGAATAAADTFTIAAPQAQSLTFTGDAGAGLDTIVVKVADPVVGTRDVQTLKVDTAQMVAAETIRFAFEASAANTSDQFDGDVLTLTADTVISSSITTFEVRTGTVDFSRAQLPSGITFDFRSGGVASLAQLQAADLFVSLTDSGSLVVTVTTAQLADLAAFLASPGALKLIGFQVAVQVDGGQVVNLADLTPLSPSFAQLGGIKAAFDAISFPGIVGLTNAVDALEVQLNSNAAADLDNFGELVTRLTQLQAGLTTLNGLVDANDAAQTLALTTAQSTLNGAITTVANNLTAEINARTAADSLLVSDAVGTFGETGYVAPTTNSIAGIKAELTSLSTLVDANDAAQTLALTTAQSTLNGAITTVANNLTAEINARTAADSLLVSDAVGTFGETGYVAPTTNSIAGIKAELTSLSTLVDANDAAQTLALTTAQSTLNGAITTVANNLTAEINARTAADSLLVSDAVGTFGETGYVAPTTNSIAGIKAELTSLSTLVDANDAAQTLALTTAQSTLNGAITTVANNLTAEINARTAADSLLVSDAVGTFGETGYVAPTTNSIAGIKAELTSLSTLVDANDAAQTLALTTAQSTLNGAITTVANNLTAEINARTAADSLLVSDAVGTFGETGYVAPTTNSIAGIKAELTSLSTLVDANDAAQTLALTTAQSTLNGAITTVANNLTAEINARTAADSLLVSDAVGTFGETGYVAPTTNSIAGIKAELTSLSTLVDANDAAQTLALTTAQSTLNGAITTVANNLTAEINARTAADSLLVSDAVGTFGETGYVAPTTNSIAGIKAELTSLSTLVDANDAAQTLALTTAQSTLNGAITSAIDALELELKDGVSADFDTLKEIGDAVTNLRSLVGGNTLGDGSSLIARLASLESSLSGFVIDKTGPAIVSSGVGLSYVGADGNGDLSQGDTVRVTVTFTEAVVVVGTPSVLLSFDDARDQPAVAKSANYVSGSGSNILVFEYVIENNAIDLTADSIGVSAAVRLDSGETITDIAGNTANLEFAQFGVSKNVDLTPPTAVLNPNTITNAGNASVQSNETGNAYLVHDSVNVSSLQSITSANNNLWNSVSVTGGQSAVIQAEGLINGTYKLYAVDAAGNISSGSTGTVLIDTPSFEGALRFASLTDTGSVDVDSPITRDNAFSLNFVGGNPGQTAIFQRSVNGTTSAPGDWVDLSISNQSNLADGVYWYRAKITDATGNSSHTAPKAVIVDRAAPNAPQIVGVSQDTGLSNSDFISSDPDPELIINSEVGSIVEVSVDGVFVGFADETETPGVFDFVNSFSGDDVYNFSIRSIDAAGNTSVANSLTFTLDTSADAPTVALSNDTGDSSSDLLTSDGTLDVSGVESGATVEYSLDDSSWSSSFTATEGSNTVYVRQTDAAGNISVANSLTFTLDTSADAPTVALSNDTGDSSSDLLTSDGTLDVSGVESGATVEYSLDDSSWSSSFTATEGSNTVYVRQTDAAGNISVANSLTFTLDTSAADAPTVALSNDTGDSSSDLLTSDGTLDVSGVESGATVEYSLDDSSWSSSFTATEGSNTVYVRQTDAAGNISVANSLTFTLDTSAADAPTVALSNDTGDSSSDLLTSDGTLDVSGVESGATVEYSLDDSSWSSSFTATEGSNTVYVRQTDAAGNISVANSLTFTLDTSADAPTVALSNDTGDSSSDLLTSDGTLDVSGVESGATVEYSLDDSSWSSSFTATEGSNTVYVRQTDALGNISVANSLTFTLDTSADAPTVALSNDTGDSSSDLLTSDGTLDVSGVESGATVEYSLDDSSWSSSFTATEGSNTVYVRQTDAAGNISVANSLTFTLDTSAADAPTVALSNDTGDSSSDLLTSDGTLDVSGVESGATVEYSLDDSSWSSSFTATEGSNTVYVRQTDAAGNISVANSLTFTLDTSADAPTVALSNDTGDSSSDLLTSDGTLDVSGVESGATVEYSLDDSSWSSSFTATEGSNTVYVRQTDALGNISVANSLTFTLDTSAADAPTVALSNDTGDSSSDLLTSDGTLDVSGVESGATVEYSLDDSSWSSSFTATEGSNTVYVRQTDAAGNISVANSLTFTLDTSAADAPTVALSNDTGDSSSDLLTSDGTLDVSGVESGATVEYSLDDSSWSSSFTATEGSNTVYVRQTDAAGNISVANSLTFTLDTSADAPTVALSNDTGDSSSDLLTSDGTLDVSGVESGATVEYSLDDSSWSSSFTATEGSNTVYVRQTDAAGNISVANSLTFTLDTSAADAPTVALSNDTGDSSSDLLTSDGTLDVSGVESGATVEYSLDDSSWSSSFTATEGSNTVYVRQTDAAGNISVANSLTFTLDTSADAPTVALSNDTGDSSSDLLTSDGTLDVSGVESGATVEYSLDDSSWSSSFTATEGSNTVYVRQTDAAGNISVANSLTFTLDTSAADAPTVALSNDTGDSSSDLLTSDGTLDVSGVESGATVEYSLDDSSWSSSFTATEGSNTVYVRQTDAAGNISVANSLTFTLDTSADAPTVALSNDTGDSSSDLLTSDGTLDVSGVESGATVEYSLDDSSWSSSFTATEGSNTVYVRQTDALGNISVANSLTFTLDTSADAPTVALSNDTGDSSSDLLTSDGTLDVSGVESGATVEYSLDDSSWSSSFTATEGSNTVYVRQTDAAGNISVANSLTFTLDTSAADAPTVALSNDTGDSSSDLLTSDGTLDVSGVESGATVEYSLDDSSWSSSFTATEGSNTVYVRQTDAAGNISVANSLTFTLDTSADAPTVALSNDTGDSSSDLLTSDGTLDVSGVESGATVEYSLDDSSWSSSFTATEGSNTVYVRQTDAAGNISVANSLTFTLDTSAADAPTVALSNDTGDSSSDLLTSDGTLDVSGVESGATVEYSLDDSSWSSSFTATEGSNTVYVRQTDAAGNISVANSLTFTLDTSADAPTVALSNDTGDSSSDLLTSDGTLDVSGVESGATVEYSLDDSSWSSSFTATEGSNTVYVRQTDALGNISVANSLTFTLDTSAADAPTVALSNDTGDSSSDLLTSDGTLDVSGVESGATVEYSLDDSSWSSSFTATEGSNTVYVRQTDAAGNISVANSLTFTLDTSAADAPTVALSNDTGDSSSDLLTSDGTLDVSGVESGATVEYSLDDSSWSSSFTATEGSNTVYVRQTDAAGNISVANSLTFTLDTSADAPTVALSNDTGDSSSDLLTSDGTLDVSGVESGATVEYSLDDSSWSSSFTATEGSNTVYVRQTDAAGNISVANSLTFTLDTSADAPTVALSNDTGDSSSDLLTSDGTLDVSGVESGATVEYSLDDSSWSSSFTATEGSNTVYVRQTDAAGNISVANSLTFTLDTSAPQINTVSYNTVTNKMSVSGTDFTNATVTPETATWDINRDNSTTPNFIFPTQSDATTTGAMIAILGDSQVDVTLRQDPASILESLFGFAGSVEDEIDFGQGFITDAAGNQSAAVSLQISLSITGSDNNDNMFGGGLSDVINGGFGDDRIRAGSGNDMIIGGQDTDVLTGGSGSDTFIFETGDTGSDIATADTITDLTAGEKIDLSGLEIASGITLITTGKATTLSGTGLNLSDSRIDVYVASLNGTDYLVYETALDGSSYEVIAIGSSAAATLSQWQMIEGIITVG